MNSQNQQEHCDTCGAELEPSQIGDCDDCQKQNRPLSPDLFESRYALMVGTLSDGFTLNDIIHGDAALAAAQNSEQAGPGLRDFVRINWPSDLSSRINDVKHIEGTSYLFMANGTSGLLSGFEVYGPFKDEEAAERYGEENRADDTDYVVMDVDSGVSMRDLL